MKRMTPIVVTHWERGGKSGFSERSSNHSGAREENLQDGPRAGWLCSVLGSATYLPWTGYPWENPHSQGEYPALRKLLKVHSHAAASSYYGLAEHTLDVSIRLLSKQQSKGFRPLLQQMQTPTARLSSYEAGKGLTSVSSSIPACWLLSSCPAMCLPTLMSSLLLS